MKHLYKLIIPAMAALVLSIQDANAQVNQKSYVNIGWQFNAPVRNSFSDKAQGWGAYIEGGYYIGPNTALGLFASYNTNNTYIPRTTYYMNYGALTTDAQHSLFQLPFGATARYRFCTRRVQPYLEAKIGANYTESSSYFSNYMNLNSSWGFYISPEIGITLYPFFNNNFGIQLAGYYSYATNSSNLHNYNGLNNAGFKIGITF